MVPRRILRIIKRVRSSARERGLPVERLMPVLEVAIGLLLGLALGALTWVLFRSSFVEYRYTTLLGITVEGERQEQAAETVAAYIREPGGDFHNVWLREADALGLRGRRYLWADIQDVRDKSASDEPIYVVRLICEGRPGGAVRRVLASACDQIRNHEPIRLGPVDYTGRMTRLAKKIGDGQQEKAKLETERAQLQPSNEESADRNRIQTSLQTAGEIYDREDQALKAMLPHEKRLQTELAALKEEQNELSDVEVAGPSVLRALADERRELNDRLKDVDLADCSADHPILSRIRQIDRRRKRGALPVLITRVETELDKIANQRRETQKADNKRSELQRQLEKINTKYAGLQRKRDDLDEKIARIRTVVNDAQARQASLRSEPRPPITVSAEGELKSHVPPYGYAFYVGGMLVGLLGTFVVHRKVLPVFSKIEDETDLADALGTPVLGKVPRLAMLVKH